MSKKIILSEERYNEIVKNAVMETTSRFAKETKIPFMMEVLFVTFGAVLASDLHNRLFKEVSE